MKKKWIILLCCLFLSTITPLIQGKPYHVYGDEFLENSETMLTFVRGKVENLTEETIDDTVFYNCTAVDVKYIWISFSQQFPFGFEYERGQVWNQDGFFIPKDSFKGLIQEGRVFGVFSS